MTKQRPPERGYMFILDRKKDMIVSGGFNIFPREVEDALSRRGRHSRREWGEAVTRRPPPGILRWFVAPEQQCATECADAMPARLQANPRIN